MLLINIKNITIEEVLELSRMGLNFIIKDGSIKGFTR